MYKLLNFFREAVRGQESVQNAVQRSLSTKTDAELLALRDGADDFKANVEAEFLSRADFEIEEDYSAPPYDAATATGMYDHD
jgi:hypothetical protein